MTCVGEDDDGEAGQGLDRALPVDVGDRAAIGDGIAFDEMGKNENDEVANCYKCDNAGILERVEAAEEGEGYHNQP